MENEDKNSSANILKIVLGIIVSLATIVGCYFTVATVALSVRPEMRAVLVPFLPTPTQDIILVTVPVLMTPPPQPTYTPPPTYTPQSETIIIVTATPLSAPSTIPPTDTQLPTATPTTIPTDTPPGSILEEGQTWYQNGLALTAKDFCTIDCLPLQFTATFILESFLDHDILIPELSGEDVVLTFNTGEVWYPWQDPSHPVKSSLPSQGLAPRTPLKWTWDFRLSYHFGHTKPIGNQTRSFTLVIERLGDRILEATWAGDIPR
jgi:hypothetical protein